MRVAPLWLALTCLALDARAQLPRPPLPRAAGSLADALEAAAAARRDDRSFVTLNSTVVDLNAGGAAPAPALGLADAAACAAACAAAPGCYAATWLDKENEAGDEETECLLFGEASGAAPTAPPTCPTLQLTTAGGGTTHLFPGAFTAAAAPCAGGGGAAAATASPLPALCARFPRLCPPPAPGGRRRLTASPRRDAGALAWGLAVDARGGAAAVHGVSASLLPPSTLEYLGSVGGDVTTATACEGYCQLMQAGADNGDGRAVPVTPFPAAPGPDGLARLAVASTGALQAHCVVATWHRPGGQGDHVCDLYGMAPSGPTTLVLAASPAGAGATTGVRAARWSLLADWEEAYEAATAAAG